MLCFCCVQKTMVFHLRGSLELAVASNKDKLFCFMLHLCFSSYCCNSSSTQTIESGCSHKSVSSETLMCHQTSAILGVLA
jgi:hypothetical protein